MLRIVPNCGELWRIVANCDKGITPCGRCTAVGLLFHVGLYLSPLMFISRRDQRQMRLGDCRYTRFANASSRPSWRRNRATR
jgi:hypothetical protein